MLEAKKQNKAGWILASGLVVFMVALAVWMHRLQQTAPSVATDGGPTPEAVLTPDGTDTPGAPVPVAFGSPELERCVPWHVSASQAPAAAGVKTLVLTSRVVDPYGYTLTGFGEDCGEVQTILVSEDLKPGQLATAVAQHSPAAILAVGRPAAEQAAAEAPDTPLLFAMVQAPRAAGLDRAGAVGVLPWVPMAPVVRHVLKVLPRKHTDLAVLYPPGAYADLAAQVAEGIRTAGRKAHPIEVTGDRLEEALAKAGTAQAWIVLPDRAVVDHRLFNRIQIAAEKDKIPLCVPDEEHVRAGAYAGAGIDSYRVGQQLCRLAGALSRGSLPDDAHVFCPEYSFAVIHTAQIEKLGYILDPGQFDQAKIYKWH